MSSVTQLVESNAVAPLPKQRHTLVDEDTYTLDHPLVVSWTRVSWAWRTMVRIGMRRRHAVTVTGNAV